MYLPKTVVWHMQSNQRICFMFNNIFDLENKQTITCNRKSDRSITSASQKFTVAYNWTSVDLHEESSGYYYDIFHQWPPGQSTRVKG